MWNTHMSSAPFPEFTQPERFRVRDEEKGLFTWQLPRTQLQAKAWSAEPFYAAATLRAGSRGNTTRIRTQDVRSDLNTTVEKDSPTTAYIRKRALAQNGGGGRRRKLWKSQHPREKNSAPIRLCCPRPCSYAYCSGLINKQQYDEKGRKRTQSEADSLATRNFPQTPTSLVDREETWRTTAGPKLSSIRTRICVGARLKVTRSPHTGVCPAGQNELLRHLSSEALQNGPANASSIR